MSGYVSTISWFDNNPHIRVYKGNGQTITEARLDSGESWTKGTFSQQGTTVGAISWLDGSDQIHIRVYVGSGPTDTITEYRWDNDNQGSWNVGLFTATGDVAAATCWVDQGQVRHIRVYVIDDSGKITEHCWDSDKDKWYEGGYPS